MAGLVGSRHDYPELLAELRSAPLEHKKSVWRQLAKDDLYFLVRYACGRIDLENDWYFERAREVQADPNGCLDLWAREHGKSSLITFGLSLSDIVNDPEVTIGIFSHTRPIAKGFLRQIKRELEANEFLKSLFPDILWANPRKEAPKWSEDDGIVVKRQGNPKESTVEAWGLVDGQPTAKHYRVRNYDDIVVPESVTSPEMIAKTTRQWELSDNLGTVGGVFRVAGTRYHFNDTYGEMMKRQVVKVRLYPCTKDGSENFTVENCQLMSPETLQEKRRVQGMYTFGTQMRLDPKGDSAEGFQRRWIAHIKGDPHGQGLNKYIVVDPANSKKKSSDWTTMGVIGLGPDKNYTLLDLVRDRLNLGERTDMLINLHKKWLPLEVGYEEYGLQSDIQHIEHVQHEENYRFKITPLAGSMAKTDRIKRLIPIFEQGRFWMPQSLHRTLYDKSTVNLIDVFIEEEYVAFPVATHDDILDMLARILDENMPVKWPLPDEARRLKQAGREDNYMQGRASDRAMARHNRRSAMSHTRPDR